MKKILIGTSALVAAAAFAGSANAADPIKLSIGGYGAVIVGYASNDDTYVQATRQEYSAVDVKGDNEIHLSGKTTLDNGLTVAVKYEIEAGGRNSDTDISDEWSISLSGNFGTIKTGADDNALVMIHNNAPRVGGRLFNGGLAGGDLIGGAYVKDSAGISFTDTAIDTNGDAEAISYISPAFAGFTFGASYVPSVGRGDDEAGTTTFQSNTAVSDAYGVGLGYAGNFGGVSVNADVGFLTADPASMASATASTNLENHSEYQAGLKFGYAGFEFGGAYRNVQRDGVTGFSDADATVWEAGVSYKTGPYAIALAYIDSSEAVARANNAATIADKEGKVWELSASYNMGPGVDLVGGLGYVSFDSEGTEATGNDNDGWVAATGLSLTF